MNLSFNKKIAATLIILTIGVFSFFLLDREEDLQGATAFEFDESAYSLSEVEEKSTKIFTHPTYGFSVEYPVSLITKAYKESDGYETIVFQSEEDDPSTGSGQGKSGFQIFISAFGEGEKITRERILEDVPFAVIEEPQEVVIGDGIRALIFWSEDPRVGRTREVWFAHEGQLYEITTYAELDMVLAEIMETWKFL